MRTVIAISCFAILGLTSRPDSPRPISPEEAIKSIGKPSVVVEMTVKGAKNRLEKRGVVFLDSSEDFKDATNLGVAVSAEAAAKFKAKGVDDPAAHFKGKKIRVKGCVQNFETRPYLPVHDPSQIELAGDK